MINIVLVRPEIPQNTGNIARTCACIGASLHIIMPCSFEFTNKSVLRAGMDYLKDVKLYKHINFEYFLKFINYKENIIFATSAKGKNLYTNISYPKICYILFGCESVGLDENILKKYNSNSIYIPMTKNKRSLNLSNSVAIIAYEYVRQQGLNINE